MNLYHPTQYSLCNLHACFLFNVRVESHIFFLQNDVEMIILFWGVNIACIHSTECLLCILYASGTTITNNMSTGNLSANDVHARANNCNMMVLFLQSFCCERCLVCFSLN
jgi:hypothetical protein